MGGLKIYLTLTGTQIVAQEIKAEGGKRVVKGASYLDMHPSGVRYIFIPLKFFEPTGEFKLYESGLLGEQDMPPMIAERFKIHLKKMEADAETLRKQLEAAAAEENE
jgi:hypothetical protein